jgi:hypothetical protein
MSVEITLNSGVYHLLSAYYNCIKVRKGLLGPECLTPFVQLPACVLSTAQKQQQLSLTDFHFYK